MQTIEVPFNWTPEKHQLPILNNSARFQVICWHRKARKTTLALNQLIRWAIAHRGTYWYVAPFFNQAKKIVWQEPEMLPKYVPPMIWDKRNNTELFIPFPNGSVLYIMGADKPDSLRGPNPQGVVLDEYGDMKADVWPGIIQPIMMANPKAWTWFIGTPRGRNDFYVKYNYAKTAGDKNWHHSLLTASQSGIIKPELLEEAKRTSTEAFFRQEYECEFLEGASAYFRRIRQNVYEATNQIDPNHTYQLGVDLAKYQDWTVLTPFCADEMKAGEQERFNQIDWNLQKARIEAVSRRYNNALLRIDSSGVGDPIVEDLERRGLNMDEDSAFTFTEKSRTQLLENLAIMLEQDQIRIPNDEGLISELEAFQYELGERGKVKIRAPSGMTDDRVMSLALAVYKLIAPSRVAMSTLIQKKQPLI